MSVQNEQPGNLVTLPNSATAGDDPSNAIDDKQFIEDLGKLKDLRSFLIEQAVQLKPDEADILSFGKLNLLHWRSDGRRPTEEEWDALEKLTQDLFRHLSDPLRRRFLYSRLPWWIPQMVGALGLIAFASLIATTFAWGSVDWNRIVPLYLIWLASLGAIGSICFIGMNALSVQDDATFDLSNSKLLTLRILLGALFGIVLSLPFGAASFYDFIQNLLGGAVAETAQSAAAGSAKKPSSEFAISSFVLLLPFVLGFSTSLVIMILNQFVGAIQTLFGKRTVAVAEPASPQPDANKP